MALYSFAKGVFNKLKKESSVRVSNPKNLLTRFGFPVILLLITAALAISNYTPGTILSGWDALHPEFDLKLNFERTFFGVFRAEQGLGALASHAHMVELPKIILFFLLDRLFPLEALRYVYIFLCLILGPMGMFYFLKNVVIKKSIPSFLGALFYLLNLGTYQTFLVPFEMFTVAYASLPLLFLATSLALANFTKKHAAFLIAVLLFASSAAYAPTLWFVIILALVLYFAPLVIFKRSLYPGIAKRFLLVLLIIFLTNAYWLLPNIYFALNGAVNVAEANINKLFSDEAFLKNKQFGTIQSILQLKIFYFDWNIYDHSTNSFVQLTRAFQDFYKNTPVYLLGYVFAGFIIGGLLYSIKLFRHLSLGLLLVLFLCLLFLFNDNPPVSFLFNWIRENVPFFKEAFRFPDNKIFNVFIFLVAIYFALFQDFVLNVAGRLAKNAKTLINSIYVLLISAGLILYMLPAFWGNFIHPTMRITIPKDYFELFNELKTDQSGRLANLPINSPWGWVYHDWYEGKKPSFQGAGFLYFGVSQSLLERDFDRWEKTNEQYYREMSHAIYSKDSTKVKSVIQKYEITHILVDESIISPGNNNSTLFYGEIKNMMTILSREGIVDEGNHFGEFLTLYRVTGAQKGRIAAFNSLSSIATPTGAYSQDNLYKRYGNYAQLPKSTYFPFEGIYNNEHKNLLQLTTGNDAISVSIPKDEYSLSNLQAGEDSIPATVVVTKNNQVNNLDISLYPQTLLFDNNPFLQPLTGSFEFSGTRSTFSVNERVFKTADLVPNQPILVGETFLEKSSNTLITYANDSPTTNYAVSQLPITFTYCDTTQNGSLSAILQGNSLKITTDNTKDVCLVLPLYFIDFSQNSAFLGRLAFTTNAKGIYACLAGITNNSCISNITIDTASSIQAIEFGATPQVTSEKRLILRIPKGNNEVVFNNLSFTTLPGSGMITLDNTSLKIQDPGIFKNVTLPLPKDDSLIFTASTNTTFVNDCHTQGNSSRKTVESREAGTAFVYTSNSENYCDHISFPDLPHSSSYLVFVKSKNIAGLPLRICVTNYTSRNCDIYSKLSVADSLETVFFLPSTDVNGRGYDVNVENIGVMRTPSENELYTIRFVPFPDALLAGIQNTQVQKSEFTGKIIRQKKVTPTSFHITTDGKDTFINLAYSYQKGFSLYELSCADGFICSIKTAFPFIFAKKVDTHTLTNRWSNGWVIDNSQISNANSQFVVVYLPQYLQYLGFLLLLIPFGHLFMPILKPLGTPFSKLNRYFERKSQYLKRLVEAKRNARN